MIDVLFQLHASVVLVEDVLDYSVLFAEIADAYFEKELFADAKSIYELLGGDLAVRSLSLLRVCTVKNLLDKQHLESHVNGCMHAKYR